jgi:hypothetical protein
VPRWGSATFSVKGVTVEAAFASTGARQAVIIVSLLLSLFLTLVINLLIRAF